MGKSPLELSGLLVGKPLVSVAARLSGYAEGLRPAVAIPREGEARVYLAGDSAAAWYTTPSWVLGLLMIAGSVAAYSQNNPESSSTGIALLGSGVGVIAISQAVARFWHIPAAAKRAEAMNAGREPLP
jgi:hypothetical protein